MKGQAAINIEAGKVSGCGFRVVSVFADQSGAEAVDFSVNIYAEGWGLMKAGYVTYDPVKKVKVVGPIQNFWLKAEGHDPAAKKGPLGQSQSPKGYLLQGTTMDDALKLLQAVMDHRPILVGVRRPKSDTDIIHSGTVDAPETDIQEVARCFGDVVRLLERASSLPSR